MNLTEELRFMNHLEIILNFKPEEIVVGLSELSFSQQEEFLLNCKEQFDDINVAYSKFIEFHGKVKNDIPYKPLIYKGL